MKVCELVSCCLTPHSRIFHLYRGVVNKSPKESDRRGEGIDRIGKDGKKDNIKRLTSGSLKEVVFYSSHL